MALSLTFNKLLPLFLGGCLMVFLIIYLPAECGNTNTIGIIKNTPASFDGYTLFTANKLTYLIDNCGNVMNKWTSDYQPGHSVYLLEDGSILRAGKITNDHFDNGGLGGRIEKKDWDDNLIWEYTYSDSLVSQHHDIFPMPNGNILLLTLTRKFKDECIAAGRKPENLADGELYNERILEIRPAGKGAEIVWQWDAWDHLIQDTDSSKENYGNVANNPQLLNINYLGLSGGKANWIHFNSIYYNPRLDEIVLASRQLNEIYVIDHSTTTAQAASQKGGRRGKGGDILYRWGNPAAWNRGTKADQQLFGPHAAYWIPEGYPDAGNIMIFNNGTGRDTLYSSVEIIAPPDSGFGDYHFTADNQGFGPSRQYFTYKNHQDPMAFFSMILSNAQRLPNGNTLINEGTKGRFFEVDPNGDIVWEYINPDTPEGILRQGDPRPNSNNIFRAFRYSKDYEAFRNRKLVSKGPIEPGSNAECCFHDKRYYLYYFQRLKFALNMLMD